MRLAFARTLAELAESDDRIFLMTGDLGYMALDAFVDRFPMRFLNVGVAEQNMLGVATGLAEAGFLPFVYSIATFASLRGYEFFRNGAVAHGLSVRIVGVGGGFEYGSAGPTHHALEDVAVMRAQPDVTVLAPADHEQTRNALLRTWDRPGPTYYRLGKDDRTTVPGLEGRFALERVETVREGGDLVFVTMGSVASEVVAAADELGQGGRSVKVVILSTLNPSPTESLVEAIQGFDRILTVESHYLNGGLGSLVAETIAERGLLGKLHRCGVRAGSDGRSGSTAFYRDKHGLSRRHLVGLVKELSSGSS